MAAYSQLSTAYVVTITFLLVVVYLANLSQGRRYALLCASIFVLAVFLLTTYTRLQLVPFNADGSRRDFLLTGDEPAYFMTALSIAQDGDIDLENNGADKDYLLFQRRPYTGSDFSFYNSLSHNRLEEQVEDWGGSRYMRHRPGTSILLSPAFLLTNHNQRFWSYTIISFCFALFIGFSIYYLGQVVGVSLVVVLVTCLICGLSPPVYFYLNQAYPEIPAGILLALISMLFLGSRRFSLLPFFLAAVVIWFSDRAILVTLLICAGGFLTLSTKKQKGWAVLILGTSGLLFACYCLHRFGVPYPISHNTVTGFSYGKIPVRLIQIFFDGRQGWVWLFPPVLLLPAMLWQILKSRNVTLNHISLIVALVTMLSLVAAFDDWGGGTCPRGRYFVISQLLFMVLTIIWLNEERGRRCKMFWLIGLGSIGLMQLFWLAQYPKWWFAGFQPMFSWKEIQLVFDYFPLLPDNADSHQWLKLLKFSPFLMLPSLSCIFLGERQKRSSL